MYQVLTIIQLKVDEHQDTIYSIACSLKLKKAETDAVIFGLTDEGYEALSINFAQIRAYMIQQDKIIDAYKKYYETEDTKKDK